MCSNYRPVTRLDRLLTFFGVEREPGEPVPSFAMLTVNADGHPVFQRMHKPGDEKRMVVILDPAEYDRWLQCSPAESATFFRRWTGPLDAFLDPVAPRGRKPAVVEPPAPPPSLF